MTEATQIRLEQLTKAYGVTRALDGLTLELDAGAITGLVGENGAGKSTLIRILSGEEDQDSGEITRDGRRWDRASRQRNVAVVHQEADRSLFPNLSVQDNLLVGRSGLWKPVPTPEVADLIGHLGLMRFKNRVLGTCPLVARQLTEIARALLQDADVFLFDEPNSALTEEESQELFGHMRTLHQSGRVVVLVSHRLNDVSDLCGRVAVVVDGSIRTTLVGNEITPHAMGSLLAGGSQNQGRRDESGEGASKTSVWPLRVVPVPGSVIAVTGPEGGGGRELVRSIGLNDTARSKEATSVAYMPSDRKTSLFPNLSVAANIAIRKRSDGHREGGIVTKRRLGKAGAGDIAAYGIRTSSYDAGVLTLSGGNQQKVALAAALATKSTVLAIEEPTRGVDLRTKTEIYTILRDFASTGGAVVFYAPEMEDIVNCADVVYVIAGGEVRATIPVGPQTTIEELGGEVAHAGNSAASQATIEELGGEVRHLGNGVGPSGPQKKRSGLRGR